MGNFFPQLQAVNGSYSHIGLSQNDAQRLANHYFDATSATFDMNWELDVWGKFRRGIQSSDASLYSSVMSYDDALVTLVADVATTYINLRGFDERIKLANDNVVVQQDALDIANVRFKAGGATELDVQQAKVQLSNTLATVPALQAGRDQAEDLLCILLGTAPRDLSDILGTEYQPMPEPPDSVTVGIPADLLRRRPDVRRAEADAAAQSAQIGVAAADLLPHFQLFGSIGYSAENPGDLLNASSLAYQLGPSFRWDILNYGRIINNVRVQDARFEELLTAYQNTVLAAQQEVADSITSFVHSREAVKYLDDSVVAAKLRGRYLDDPIQIRRRGLHPRARRHAVPAQPAGEQVVSRINTATSAIALNKALGGGWELRQGHEFVPAGTVEEMRHRTNWGDITKPGYDKRADDVFFPRPDTDAPHPNSK